jgi:hypothetical protein
MKSASNFSYIGEVNLSLAPQRPVLNRLELMYTVNVERKMWNQDRTRPRSYTIYAARRITLEKENPLI